jgi:RNA polymerase sigma-70 factor (ECF subfamily)
VVLGIDDLELSRDRSLVERVRLGDEEAFSELYRLHYDRLYRYCLYRLGEDHEAQDVVQEAFTRAWLNAPRIQADLKFYPWLRTIAGNLCTDVGRRRARVQPAPTVDTGSTDGGQDRMVELVDIALLEQAMSRLPARHRQVLELREGDGLSYEQLADRTGTSVGTIESLLWRARQGLKRQFAVVSGESVLAGLPVVGWLYRRAHSAHTRVSAQVADWYLDGVSTLGGAIGGLAVGSVVAVAFVVGGVGAPASNVRPATIGTAVPVGPTSTTGLLQLVSQSLPTHPVPADATAGQVPTTRIPAAPTQGSTAGGRTELTDPVQTNQAAARQEAQQDPMRVSVAGTTVGADPQAVFSYVASLVSLHPNIP